MNERGDRCGAFHGVGQPDVKRQLRALAGSAQQQAEANNGENAAGQYWVLGGIRGQFAADFSERQRAEVGEQQKDTDEKTEVADAIDDEGLLARSGRQIASGTRTQ